MKNDIFKVCFLDEKGFPFQYFLFSGNESKNHTTREFFSNVEWEYVLKAQLESHIHICDYTRIHYDDSIHTIKKKIAYFQKIAKTENFLMEEMYLLAVLEKSFHPLKIFKDITQQDTKPFTKAMLDQFLANYHGLALNDLEDTIFQHPLYISNDVFTYEDLLEFEWFYSNTPIKTKLCKTALGFRFIEKPHEYNDSRIHLNQDLFANNPYDILFPYVYKPSNQVRLNAFPNDFLFKHGKLIENTIYVCLLPNLELFLEEKNQPLSILDIYFPKLESTASIENDDAFWEENKLIDMIFDIHDYRSEITYKEYGISSFHFIIHPEIPSKLPLESFFKNIHASIQIPLIQYNPGLRREKMLRLYFTHIAKNGNKIPFLKKEVVEKLTEKPGKISNISMFMPVDVNIANPTFITVSLEANGNIVIQGELETALMPEAFNEWISMMIYPAIHQLNTFTQQTGYYIRPFHNILDDFIEVISLQYRCIVDLPKKLELEKYMGIFSPIFYNELSGEKKRYKRIEYFQRMNPEEEYISELLRVTQDRKMIQSELRKQFPELSYDQSREIMQKYQEKHQNTIVPGRYTNSKIEVLNHTGFPVQFQKSTFLNEWRVDVQNITSVHYVSFLHLFLDTLFQISQSPELVPKEIYEKYKRKKIVNATVDTNTNVMVTAIPENMVLPVFKDDVMFEDESFELDVEYEQDEDEENEENEENEGGGRKKKEVTENTEIVPKPTKKQKADSDSEDENKDKDEQGNLKTLDNYFKRRIKQRNLLLSKTGFTKICPANEKRHPIILTEKEKLQIDEDYPDPKNKPYNHALKYGLDKEDKPFYYICPNYWCIQPGKEGPITEEDVENKKCGEVIQDPKNIQPGEYTYKWREGFNDPGFVNRKVKKGVVIDPKTGKEICYPCCFQNWYGKAQKELRQKCNPEEYAVEEKKKKGNKKKTETIAAPPIIRARNVLQLNWVPLPYHRQGLLPIPIQFFLNATSYNACIDSNNMPKLTCPVLIRYGVAMENQYFLGCLAEMYSYQRNEVAVKSNKEMREILCSAISLDRFVQLHNASLVSLFQRQKDDFLVEPGEVVTIGNYRETQLYKRLDLQNDTHIHFLESTIYAYENFLRYLRDETVILDPTYLWEAVTQKNPEFLPRGLNLAILEIMNQDITNNVELVCPTNTYTAPLYDPKKETLIIVKQGDVYEPVYLYEITSLNPERSIYKKTFQVDSTNDVGDLPIILKMVQKWTLEQCGPPKRTFEQNIMAREMVFLLNDIGYKVTTQVLNYQHKVIGFLVLDKADPIIAVFVPTFPSPMIDNLASKWMDDPSLWQDHDVTLRFLQKLYKKSDKKIMCDPLFRILEDEKVIGFLTKTNQFIQIMPYIDNRDFRDKIEVMNESNYIIADRSLMTTEKEVEPLLMKIKPRPLNEKERMMRNIRLETQFYAGFRNTVRILLNMYKSRHVKENIRNLFSMENMSYRKKRKRIEEQLRELCSAENVFTFQEYDDDVLSNIQDIFTCQTDCDKKTYCLTSTKKNGTCQMILPELNLVNREKNESIYFTRMADELLRFKRIQLFMMKNDAYLYISSSEYKIYANEFVIAKSGLTDEYFDKLERFPLEKYVKTTTYETGNPSSKPANPTQSWIDVYKTEKRK
jgi:hypothetical protein